MELQKQIESHENDISDRYIPQLMLFGLAVKKVKMPAKTLSLTSLLRCWIVKEFNISGKFRPANPWP